MNGPSSDGNENVVDIFVLCKSETEAPLKTEHLEQKGYRVTLFSDSNSLLDTLRLGKPNLLICDSLSLGQEAFDVCRQVKADNNLWMMPVLILTGATNLSDLLFVLDCNADNFIAYPPDPSYLLSLIEGMLVTPVERQTPDQIKTQFRIQHDEHAFVVTADRRKLLEFLLSSFEIAVRKSDELLRAETDHATLMRSVKRSEETAAEQTRVIDILHANLQQSEQKATDLAAEVKDTAYRLSDAIREKEFLLDEREANKTRIAALEGQIRMTGEEKDELVRSHNSETGELRQQITDLSSELTKTKTDLGKLQQDLAGEIAKRETAESTLRVLVPEKEQLEKSLKGLSLEHEQVKSSFTAEKNRAHSAEQEIRALHQAKVESEQDLTRIINDLKGTAKQQAGEIIALREERVTAQDRITTLETSVNRLAGEKEQVECALKQTAETLRRNLADLQEKYDAAVSDLEEKHRQNLALEEVLNELKSSWEQSQRALHTLQEEGISAQNRIASLESQLIHLGAEKEQVETELAKKAETFQRDIADLREKYLVSTSTLEEKNRQNLALEKALSEMKDSFEQSRETIHDLEDDLKTVRDSLEREKEEHASAAAHLQAAVRERDSTLATLRGAHDEVKTDLDAHRDDLSLVKSELAAATARRSALESQLEESSARIQHLEEDLHAASLTQAESDKQVRSLATELDRIKILLETERRQYSVSEEDFKSLTAKDEQYQEDLRKSRQEQERLAAALSNEVEQHRKSEESAHAADEIKDRRIQDLISDLTAVTGRLHSLEEQVRILAREKAEADEKVESLSAEINQARTALADEWEDHMTDHERLAAVQDGKSADLFDPQREQDPDGKKNHAEVTRTTVLPIVAEKTPLAVAIVNDCPGSDVSPVAVHEDLFEDEKSVSAKNDDAPTVSIIREPDIKIPMGPVEVNHESEISPAGGDPMDAETGGKSDLIYEPDPGDDADTASLADESRFNTRSALPMEGIAFNRTQWLDLLKWAHHSNALSQEQRLQIVRMGRLIQKGRRLTRKQDEQVREMIMLAQSLGYRFS
jgi:chromosome segregation ATPase